MQQEKDKLFEELMEAYLSGILSVNDKERLFSLIQESEEYQKQYKERMKLFALLHVPRLEADKSQKVKQLENRLRFTRSHPSKSVFIYLRSVAAAILLVIASSFGSVWLYDRFSGPDSSTLYETVVPLGSQTKIHLPDGSIVHLNSGSILQYPLSYGKKEREVYLKGEGYFEVAKDKTKEFLVHVDDLRIKVLGTKFNVRSYMETPLTEVTLVEGEVEVGKPDQSIRLFPDQKVIYNQVTGVLEKISTESYKAALWTTGRLSFVNTSFTDILKDIERKYNVKIHVESELARKEFFSGSINLDMTFDEVFRFIDVDNKYLYEHQTGVIILKDR